jgi:hypothetical protein
MKVQVLCTWPAGVFGKAGVAHTVFEKNCVGSVSYRFVYTEARNIRTCSAHIFSCRKTVCATRKASWRYGPVNEGAGVFVINPDSPSPLATSTYKTYFFFRKRKSRQKETYTAPSARTKDAASKVP